MIRPPIAQGQEGQASVELALTLPVVVVLVLAAAQVGLIGRDHLLVTHAARGAAREAAVDARAASVRAAALAAAPSLKGHRLSTETRHGGGSTDIVTVTVHYRCPTAVPIVGSLLPEVELEAKAAFRYEADT